MITKEKKLKKVTKKPGNQNRNSLGESRDGVQEEIVLAIQAEIDNAPEYNEFWKAEN